MELLEQRLKELKEEKEGEEDSSTFLDADIHAFKEHYLKVLEDLRARERQLQLGEIPEELLVQNLWFQTSTLRWSERCLHNLALLLRKSSTSGAGSWRCLKSRTFVHPCFMSSSAPCEGAGLVQMFPLGQCPSSCSSAVLDSLPPARYKDTISTLLAWIQQCEAKMAVPSTAVTDYPIMEQRLTDVQVSPASSGVFSSSPVWYQRWFLQLIGSCWFHIF